MSNKHAVLGLLLEGPAYQYQLLYRLSDRLGPAWELDSGQLSRIMHGLEKEDLIVPVESAAGADPRQCVYGIVEQGVEELQRWHDEEERVRLPRRPLLVKLALGGRRRLEDDALAKLDAYENSCVRLGERLARLLKKIPPDGPLARADHVLLRVHLNADIVHVEGELKWSQLAREAVIWLQANDAAWPPFRESRDG